MFSDLLETARGDLESGSNVVFQVEAEPSGDQVKLLARSVTPLDQFVADAGADRLAVEITSPDTPARLAELLARLSDDPAVPMRARGPVRARLSEGDLLIDIEIATDAPLTPPARQAIRALPGVVNVLDE